jgi:hypothetical protein
MSSSPQNEKGVLIPYETGKCCCTIIASPNGIFFTKDGVEYYFVEISCVGNIQYKIQAFGEEAIQLYKEVQKFRCSNQTEGT